MRKYQLFLSYYSTIIITSLFIWSFFYVKGSQGFLITLLLLPISLYFWLLVTGFFKNRNDESLPITKLQNLKFALFTFLFALFISALSLFSYSQVDNHFTARLKSLEFSKEVRNLKKELENANRTKGSYENVMLELTQLKNELTKLRDQPNGALGNSDKQASSGAKSQAGFVTLKDNANPTSNVYQEKDLSSKVVGKVQFGTDYVFLQKEKDWYFIGVGNNQQGWIESQLVKEVY